MANVKFEGVDEDLTAPGTPWIYYGVNMFHSNLQIERLISPRVLMPAPALLTCGFFTQIWSMVPSLLQVSLRMVLSSPLWTYEHVAVTHAAVNNWEYMDIIRRAADPTCSSHLESSIQTIDSFLARPSTAKIIKTLFGLGGLQNNADFGALLEVRKLCLSGSSAYP